MRILVLLNCYVLLPYYVTSELLSAHGIISGFNIRSALYCRFSSNPTFLSCAADRLHDRRTRGRQVTSALLFDIRDFEAPSSRYGRYNESGLMDIIRRECSVELDETSRPYKPSCPIYLRPILLSLSYLCLGFTNNLFPLDFPTKMLFGM
jgi:hypothetical protein